jgi:hypothetical protein
VINLDIPIWAEFGVERCFNVVMQNPTIRAHIPDTWGPGHRVPEREYFFKVVGTFMTDWLRGEIDRLTDLRAMHRMREQPKKPATLQMSSRWA